MAKKSDSRQTGDGGLDEVLDKMRRQAAPSLAQALNLDSAEAIEAALNAGVELVLAARAVVRALPLPPEARKHLDRAEAEALRAARMAARGLNRPGGKKKGLAPKQVKVDFAEERKPLRRKEKR